MTEWYLWSMSFATEAPEHPRLPPTADRKVQPSVVAIKSVVLPQQYYYLCNCKILRTASTLTAYGGPGQNRWAVIKKAAQIRHDKRKLTQVMQDTWS
jgi:hypothetical protein